MPGHPSSSPQPSIEEREILVKEKQLKINEKEAENRLRIDRITKFAPWITAIVALVGFVYNNWITTKQIESNKNLEEAKFQFSMIEKSFDAPFDKQIKYIKFLKAIDIGDAAFKASLDKILKDPTILPTFVRQAFEEHWEKENLKVSSYRNGRAIFHAQTRHEWDSCNYNKIGCWCYYMNDPIQGAIYGKIYNWYAVKDTNGLAPSGYHVASLDEVKKVSHDYNYNGNDMKSTSGWLDSAKSYNGATNATGLNCLAGGYCDDSLRFNGAGVESRWWTTSLSVRDSKLTDSAYYFYLRSNIDSLNWNPLIKSYGCYVRLIKNVE